jgi:hypothetical protein
MPAWQQVDGADSMYRYEQKFLGTAFYPALIKVRQSSNWVLVDAGLPNNYLGLPCKEAQKFVDSLRNQIGEDGKIRVIIGKQRFRPALHIPTSRTQAHGSVMPAFGSGQGQTCKLF